MLVLKSGVSLQPALRAIICVGVCPCESIVSASVCDVPCVEFWCETHDDVTVSRRGESRERRPSATSGDRGGSVTSCVLVSLR